MNTIDNILKIILKFKLSKYRQICNNLSRLYLNRKNTLVNILKLKVNFTLGSIALSIILQGRGADK